MKTNDWATPIGTLAVRRSIHIAARPDVVWREFEDVDRFRRWFGLGHTLVTYEAHVGGLVEIAVQHEGQRLNFTGRVLVFDPARELTFENDWQGRNWEGAPLITFRLSDALGGTLVELYHHAIERTGPTRSDDHLGFEQGWSMLQLEALRSIVEA